jgi:photosystem II stability/assembly factor-like uncharacterized protein
MPRSLTAALLAIVFLLPTGMVLAAENSDPAPLAARALLLDVARAGDRLIAVGAYGNVVVSTDEGVHWRQVIVPTRAMLTAVSFPDANHGWAVGHDGVILATTDGGEHWVRQDSRQDLETVYLDVLFLDAQRGFAVGAYGKFLATTDGGKSWAARQPVEDEMHFNRIARMGDGRIFLAGESGMLLASTDEGATWEPQELPYDGSIFGVVESAAGEAVVAYGLRGHILVANGADDTWEKRGGEVPVVLLGGLRLRESRAIFLAGQGGNFFVSRDQGATFTPWKPEAFSSGIADLLEAKDGALVTVGEAGAVRLTPPR